MGLNLFLVGAVTTHLLRAERRQAAERDVPFLFRAGQGLNASGRSHLHQVVKRHRPDLLPRRQAMRQARRDVQAALASEPFDRQALNQKLAKLREETTKSQTALHAALSEVAVELTPTERKHMAEASGRFGRGERRRRP